MMNAGNMGNPNSMNHMNGMNGMSGMNGMNRERMGQKQLLEWVMMLTVCAVDMNLYLDTHPQDQEAMDYYNQCVELLKSAKRTYEASYGSFTAAAGVPYESSFTWVETPMPWEGGNC